MMLRLCADSPEGSMVVVKSLPPSIGEVLDVTGWLGGFNFQWAWASGHCAGLFVEGEQANDPEE